MFRIVVRIEGTEGDGVNKDQSLLEDNIVDMLYPDVSPQIPKNVFHICQCKGISKHQHANYNVLLNNEAIYNILIYAFSFWLHLEKIKMTSWLIPTCPHRVQLCYFKAIVSNFQRLFNDWHCITGLVQGAMWCLYLQNDQSLQHNIDLIV